MNSAGTADLAWIKKFVSMVGGMGHGASLQRALFHPQCRLTLFHTAEWREEGDTTRGSKHSVTTLSSPLSEAVVRSGTRKKCNEETIETFGLILRKYPPPSPRRRMRDFFVTVINVVVMSCLLVAVDLGKPDLVSLHPYLRSV